MENIEKMSYAEFKEALKKQVQEKSDADVEVKIIPILKNNQTESENLTYTGKNYNLFPSIRLKEFYKKYQELGMDWCVDAAVSILGDVKKISKDQLIGTWESAKGRIVMELVKRSWNQERLGDIPYKAFLDLAIIYRLKLCECRSGDVVHTVTNEMMEYWNITGKELDEAAFANLQKEDFMITDLKQEICNVMQVPMEQNPENDDKEWAYVFTNRRRTRGAIAMLRTDLLDAFAKAQEMDFFILPSSVHDVLLVPAKNDENISKLRKTVRDINEDTLEPEEWLSDEVYYFRRSTGAVELIPE
ncbi:DUF5688 family protein [Schaedlerella arabinosiphila]|jgi:hypothetical protein|uniref:DUF5688 family protein n=1 Tax=Schaedlerella arabinosiphila TaxID=2044587 RepID=UPI0025580602|nr:DUF5688 family protein [Schaedlerella arabinosiphila]